MIAPAAAANEPDPVFATIERHRELSDRLSAATAVSAKILDGPEFEAADAISAARAEELGEYAETLLCTEPTTIEGAVVLTRYVANLGAWQMPVDDGYDDEGEVADTPNNWQQVFLDTLADALDNIRARG
ncbi:hypothetical protein XH94_32620 [Bradyrhizobium zhanjiangense]|uniref:Uncharacterized protein n=1 Tax=Bradyrhizobium zhanjiangense TaxID=1325107 RepID=A0A4Q0SC36_9BRAD|nr:hypothetical protein XH94_32620 [Bradyrhizobium zhanjiangense]